MEMLCHFTHFFSELTLEHQHNSKNCHTVSQPQKEEHGAVKCLIQDGLTCFAKLFLLYVK